MFIIENIENHSEIFKNIKEIKDKIQFFNNPLIHTKNIIYGFLVGTAIGWGVSAYILTRKKKKK